MVIIIIVEVGLMSRIKKKKNFSNNYKTNCAYIYIFNTHYYITFATNYKKKLMLL